MVEDDWNVRMLLDQPRGGDHLRGMELHVEGKAVRGQTRVVRPPRRVLDPLDGCEGDVGPSLRTRDDVADAAQVLRGRDVALDRLAGLSPGEIDEGDDGVRHSMRLADSVDPCRLRDGIGQPAVALHVDRADQIVRGLGAELFDQVVALDRGRIAEGLGRADVAQPRVADAGRVRDRVPEMVMGVDDPHEPTLATRRASQPMTSKPICLSTSMTSIGTQFSRISPSWWR